MPIRKRDSDICIAPGVYFNSDRMRFTFDAPQMVILNVAGGVGEVAVCSISGKWHRFSFSSHEVMQRNSAKHMQLLSFRLYPTTKEGSVYMTCDFLDRKSPVNFLVNVKLHPGGD